MLCKSRDKGEHHFTDVALNRFLKMAILVQVQQTFLFEALAALVAGVNNSRVMIENFVSHQIFAQIKGTFTFVTFKMRSHLAVFVNITLVSFSDVVAAEHSSAKTALNHQLLIMLGCDVPNQELFMFKHLKEDKLLNEDFFSL
jgi:hypothetical protein